MTLQAPFRFDIVGSFLRPDRIKEARDRFARGEIAALDLKQVEDEEIARLIENRRPPGSTPSPTVNSGGATGTWTFSGVSRESPTLNWNTATSSTERRPPGAPPSSPGKSAEKIIHLWSTSSM